MELNAYQKAVIESARGDQKLSRTEKLSRLVIGLNEESGEVASITKKVLYHGRPLDLEHVNYQRLKSLVVDCVGFNKRGSQPDAECTAHWPLPSLE